MTHETLPLNAVSRTRLHVPPQVVVFIITSLLVCISVVLFMMNSTSDQVDTMLTTQNRASLKLWSNLEYYEHHAPVDASLPPGLMDDVVEFSRTNANIIKTGIGLLLTIFSHQARIGKALKNISNQSV